MTSRLDALNRWLAVISNLGVIGVSLAAGLFARLRPEHPGREVAPRGRHR